MYHPVSLLPLDTGRLWRVRHTANEVAEAHDLAEEVVMLSIALFGQVNVIAHEFMDLPVLLSGRLRDLVKPDRPLVQLFGWEDTISEMLAYNLKRPPRDALVLCSIPNGYQAAREWSANPELKQLSNSEIINLALEFPPYETVVEEMLDLEQSGVTLRRVQSDVPTLRQMMDEASQVLTEVSMPETGWPDTLSAAYQIGVDLYGTKRADLNKFLGPYDLVTRWRYASLTEAMPLIDHKVSRDDAAEVRSDRQLISVVLNQPTPSVRLDWDKYVDSYGDFRERLQATTVENYLAVIGERPISALRDKAWRLFKSDATACAGLLNDVLDEVDKRLLVPSATRPNRDLRIELWGHKIGISGEIVDWLATGWRRLRRLSIHGLVSFDDLTEPEAIARGRRLLKRG